MLESLRMPEAFLICPGCLSTHKMSELYRLDGAKVIKEIGENHLIDICLGKRKYLVLEPDRLPNWLRYMIGLKEGEEPIDYKEVHPALAAKAIKPIP